MKLEYVWPLLFYELKPIPYLYFAITPFHHCAIALFYRFPIQSLLFTLISLICTPISLPTWVSARGTAWCLGRGGAVRGGFPCVARRRLWPCPWCYPGVQFNLLSRSPIPDTSPVPVPAGDWGADLHGSSVNRTSQRQYRCVRLPSPVLVKGVIAFSLPWIDSVERFRLGLLSLAFRPLKEQTAKNVSVGCYGAYHDCLSWYFPTWPGVLSLDHTCTCPRQRLLVWHQWWHRLDYPINLISSRPPSFPIKS